MVKHIPYSFLSMSHLNVALNQIQLVFITSARVIMISGKISWLNQEKQCFLLRVLSLRETSYSNKESSKLFKAEVLFMEVENMRLSIHLFLKDKWEKEKCITPSILILFTILQIFIYQQTISFKVLQL
jgi:hypothetical protein